MEVELDYDYDEDYEELFKTFVLKNVSLDDFENITISNAGNATLDNRHDSANSVSATDWFFVLNVISGFGILTNSILLFMIIVDFVIDRKRRYLTRHWLLLNSAVTNIVYLAIVIYMKEYTLELGTDEKSCLVFQHTEKTVEFVIILYLIAIAINVLTSIARPHMPCGKRNVLFWVFFILFLIVCANMTVLALFTMTLNKTESGALNCELNATMLLPSSTIYLVTIVTFFLPYGIILSLAVSSLLCSCAQQRKLTTSLSAGNDLNTARKHSAVFVFITCTAGFLLMLPFYTYQVPDIADAIVRSFHTNTDVMYYVIILIKLLFYLVFPVICLCLKEVRTIYRKAVSN